MKSWSNIYKRESVYQYLLALPCNQDEAPFEASSLVHFRKRISSEMLQEINERIVKRQLEKEKFVVSEENNDVHDEDSPVGHGDVEPTVQEEKELPKQGKLLIDATCVPADMRFPTDLVY